MNHRLVSPIAAAAFVGCILAANYVTTEYGMVPVGFGLVATAGTYLAGLTFVLRDSVQDLVKRSLTRREYPEETVLEPAYSAEWRAMAPQLEGLMRKTEVRRPRDVEPPAWKVALPVVALIAIGAALSYLVADPFIALASSVAFLFAELVDLAVYTPLRRRGYVRAAVASNIVGAVVDTFLFLWIAGFPIGGAWQGQVVGKLAVTAVVVALVAVVRGSRKAVTA